MTSGVCKNKKKGYLEIHVAVNIKTKEILALEVTDEKGYDGKMMKKLVEHVLDYRKIITKRANVFWLMEPMTPMIVLYF